MNFKLCFCPMSRPTSTDQLIQDAIEALTKVYIDQPFEIFNPRPMYRGITPDDIVQTCDKLCRTYISGSWQNVRTPTHLTVELIPGALTNQLYRVQLVKNVPRMEVNNFFKDIPEPDDVAIKFYLPKYRKTMNSLKQAVDSPKDEDITKDERYSDHLIMGALSRSGVTPRVHGVFKSGFIQDYVEHEHFSLKHQKDPAMMAKLATLLARIHHVSVPLRKTDVWPLCEMNYLFDKAYKAPEICRLIQRLNLPELKKTDLSAEFGNLQIWLKNVFSPMVFSHNDFIGSNILVVGKEEEEKKLFAVDFEYASYFPRAFDVAVFHAQWGLEPTDFENLDLPDNLVLRQFLKYYIAASEKISPGFKQNPMNGLDKMVRETKVFFLAYLMFKVAFAMFQPSSIYVGSTLTANLLNAEKYLHKYLEVKKRLVADNTIRLTPHYYSY